MSENKYVKKISDVERGRILQNSVAALSAKPTLNATEMKMRFVKPIIDTDKDAPSIAKEIDRVADETDAALQAQEKTMDSIDNNVIAIGSKVLEIESDLGGVQRKVSSMEDEITGINITLSPIPSQVHGVNMRLDSVESDIKYGKVSYITASIDSRNYVLTFTYYGTDNFKMGSTSIDLPLESMVVGAEYNKDTKSLILRLKSGESILVPLEDIFAGLINESEKGAPNGVTPLDENGKVPEQHIPDKIVDIAKWKLLGESEVTDDGVTGVTIDLGEPVSTWYGETWVRIETPVPNWDADKPLNCAFGDTLADSLAIDSEQACPIFEAQSPAYGAMLGTYTNKINLFTNWYEHAPYGTTFQNSGFSARNYPTNVYATSNRADKNIIGKRYLSIFERSKIAVFPVGTKIKLYGRFEE